MSSARGYDAGARRMFFDALIVMMSGLARREPSEFYLMLKPPPHNRLEHLSTSDEIVAQHQACAYWLHAGEVDIRREMERRVAARLRRGSKLKAAA